MFSTSLRNSEFSMKEENKLWNKSQLPWNETISSIMNDIQSKMKELDDVLKQTIPKPGELYKPVFGCKDIATLNTKIQYPLVKVQDKGNPYPRAVLKISETESTLVEVKTSELNMTFTSNKEVTTRYDAVITFRKILIEIIHLIKAKDWYGIPRLRAICLSISSDTGFQPWSDNYITANKVEKNNWRLW